MKQYEIIYADPPWNESGGGKIKRGADRHYPLMKTKEIMALQVPSANNAHLYLWVTNNFMADGLKVMEAWGFKYKTMITWHKDRFGLGQYFRGQTEHCLFGVKGMIPYKTENGKRQQGTTVFEAPRNKHSQKPIEMIRLIEKVSDREGFNKLEMFARERRQGWDIWGNELDNDVELGAQAKINFNCL
jgi:N6-adenosine-specific RNA methylase IME4